METITNRRYRTCPECGGSFHACPSCGLLYDYEYNYCSFSCYKKSLTYDEKKRTLIRLIEESFKDIYKLDELNDYIKNNISDEIMLFLEDEDVQISWYRRNNA